ncbi:MAG: ABC transporter permease [Sideroxydans sp.]|nr:ABC transporter permease [Sideroxydans sp.]
MNNSTPLRRSLEIQARVIGALLMREILTRYGRHNIGFLWLFVEPMMFTLGVSALWTFTGMKHGSSMPIVAFALTGYSSILVWRNMPNRLCGCIEPNLALMYHRNVKVMDVFAARMILEGAGATVSFILLGIVFTSIGWMSPPEDILKVMQGWFMLIWFGASLGTLIGAWSARSEIVDKIWHPATYLLFPLSGAAFMVDWLPSSTQKIIQYIPMVHGVEMVREGYFGSAVHAHYDLAYMAIVCLCMNLLGLAILREVGRKVVPE